MNIKTVLAACTVLSLAACNGVPSPEQRAANDLNPSGRPYVGPSITRVTTPPGDINTFNPVSCHIQGQGTTCQREGASQETSAASDLW